MLVLSELLIAKVRLLVVADRVQADDNCCGGEEGGCRPRLPVSCVGHMLTCDGA